MVMILPVLCCDDDDDLILMEDGEAKTTYFLLWTIMAIQVFPHYAWCNKSGPSSFKSMCGQGSHL
jgi:hypothetical protein